MKFLAPIPPSVRSAPDLVALRLREAIFTGELRSGEQLPPETELAKGFGIALMTVRAALSGLRDVGLLVTVRGRNGGTFVSEEVGERIAEAARQAPLSKADIRDLTDWRRGVAGEACFLAARRATGGQLQRLEEAATEFDSHGIKFPEVRFADAKYHTLIAEISGSASLARQEVEIQGLLTKLILGTEHKPLKSKEIAGYSHDEITSAILSGNGEAARQAMIDHAEYTFIWTTMLL
ncbi:FCD domain-containing protein [Pseudomonas entomophila]|uniref:FadR/GntR family transcriptional regulator n=1 Tax=Pseudomonas entomophila TaxID=312306 RepID=UPI0023D853B7|nr:FCD domain-containing protein [Pseudomonas entomophila]MDF0731557.1 FCD domain-containing protein [Pseudomonas entomophila]